MSSELATTTVDPRLKLEVIELIQNNWPATRIRRYMAAQYQEELSLHDIEHLALTVPKEERIPIQGLHDVASVEVRMDPLQEYSRLLLIQAERVRVATLHEDVTEEDQRAQRRNSGVVGQLIRDYGSLLKEYVELAQSLGEMKQMPKKQLHAHAIVDATTRANRAPTLAEIANESMGRSLGEPKGDAIPEPELKDGNTIDSTARVIAATCDDEGSVVAGA